MNDFEMAKIHREELMREIEGNRLARRLREERNSGVRSFSLDRIMAALRAAFGGKPGVGDCEG